MNNKKSLLQDSLQELENIKNESLELAKEQLINESADLLEKKSAALFEKIIAGEDVEEEVEESKVEESKEKEEESKEEKSKEKEEESKKKDESIEESVSLNEILSELNDLEDEDSDEEDMDDSDDEEEMDIDALRKAAEEHGFKLVQADSEEEEMDSDEEEMDSDEEEMDDSDDEEDIEFGDEESDDNEFSDVNVDDKVLAEPSDDEEEGEEESFQKINENFKRNNTKMRNTKKQVLKDLRDVSFNKLVEAYYNMGDNDSFIIKENEYMDKYMEEDMYDEGMHMMDMDTTDEGYGEYEEGYDSMMDEDMYDEGYGMEDEGVMYEIDMNDEGYEHSMMDEELTEDEINEMLAEMDAETSKDSRMVKRAEEASGMNKMQPKKSVSELEEMFQEMTMEELQEMNALLQEDDLVEVDPKQDYPMEEDYSDLTEAQIEEIMNSMREEDEIEESSAINSRTTASVGNDGADEVAQGRPDRRSLAEEDEEVLSLREQLKKLKQENKALNEGFTNKVKSLENKVYDVTISALKAGFVNKFLLEHPLRENEKLQIIHRFANAQTKEQIKETYISLTNEFAKGQTVKDGSMLNESVQNKVGKIHRADNALVKEKDLINESDESNRFKQLLNYNFGKKK